MGEDLDPHLTRGSSRSRFKPNDHGMEAPGKMALKLQARGDKTVVGQLHGGGGKNCSRLRRQHVSPGTGSRPSSGFSSWGPLAGSSFPVRSPATGLLKDSFKSPKSRNKFGVTDQAAIGDGRPK
jgi:hypothetical protein